MKGRFSEREEEWGGEKGEVGDERQDQQQVKMTFWNACGWTYTDGGEVNRGVRDDDMRAKVLKYYQPDIVALAETWLRGKEGA